MQRSIVILALLLLGTLSFAASAQAYGLITWNPPHYQDDEPLEKWLDYKQAAVARQSSFAELIGQSFDVYHIGGYAGSTSTFGTGGDLAAHQLVGGNSGNNWTSAETAMIQNALFEDLIFQTAGRYFSLTDNNLNPDGLAAGGAPKAFSLWKLEADWMGFKAGSWIIGIEDKAPYNTTQGIDYNDMVIVLSPTAATPVPAAVWLLGTGLAGLIALRRRAR